MTGLLCPNGGYLMTGAWELTQRMGDCLEAGWVNPEDGRASQYFDGWNSFSTWEASNCC